MQIKDHAYYIDNAPFSSEDLGVLELQLRDAIYAVDVDVVRELISNGVDVNLFAWDEGTTPIGSASEDGSSEIVSLLLKAGANPNFGNSFYPLSMACSNGHLEVVKVLIDAGVDLNCDNSLHHAAAMGHLQIVKLLVEAGADVNSRGENGSSALMASARNCHWNVFDYLAPYTSQQIQDDVANLAKWLAENNIKK